MKNLIKIKYIFLVFLMILFSCDKEYDFQSDNKVAVNTLESSEITKNSVKIKAVINTNNGSKLTERGVCYSLSTNPTIANGKFIDNNFYSDLGEFTITVTNLSAGTKYYAKAYATNSYGTAYGEEITFTTLPATPAIVTTNSIYSITQNSAYCSGNISDDGGATVTERGFCYSTNTTSPTISNSKISSGTGIGSFYRNITQLSSGTTYYVRAYSVNKAGVSYGNTLSFKTQSATIPSGISINAVNNISYNAATFGGNLTSDGGATLSAQGFVYSSSNTLPTLSNSVVYSTIGTGNFSTNVSSLTPSTIYYVRAFATNSVGTVFSNTVSFTTSPYIAIGQVYAGGIIAYIFQSGDNGYVAGQTHGLIIPTSISTSTYQWGCYGTSISTSSSLGAGNSNTINIAGSCGSSSAAYYAYYLSTGGYSDWYLPSYAELQKIYSNKSSLSIPNNYYWSSSQYNSNSAYLFYFGTGTFYSQAKNNYYYALPIRQF
jgi:hypothetical protein